MPAAPPIGEPTHEQETKEVAQAHPYRPRALLRHHGRRQVWRTGRRLRRAGSPLCQLRALSRSLPYRRARRPAQGVAQYPSRRSIRRELPHDRSHDWCVCDGIFPRYRSAHGRRRCRHALLPGGRAVPELCRGQEPQIHRRHDGYRPRLRQHRARRHARSDRPRRSANRRRYRGQARRTCAHRRHCGRRNLTA